MLSRSPQNFLFCPTPIAWFDAAVVNQRLLLIDHANCEKKAAATAMNLMYRYTTRAELLSKMSQLAREELLHFQQVVEIMAAREIRYQRLSPSRYAAGLGELVDHRSAETLVYTLIMGAFIEARSCERFAGLVPRFEEIAAREADTAEAERAGILARFYKSLLKSEQRHYEDYLALAVMIHDGDIAPRVARFAAREAELVLAPDSDFRFHSGLPSTEA